MPVNNSCLSEYDEVDYAIRVQKPCYPLEPIPGTVAADPLVRQYPEGQLVPANRWFRNAPDGEMLREMKHTSDTFERVLSLLIVPQFYPRWAIDGEEAEDDTYDRFIGGGR